MIGGQGGLSVNVEGKGWVEGVGLDVGSERWAGV